MKVYELIVEAEREAHIAHHHVSVSEVEEVVFGNHLVHRTRERRFRLVGQTIGGRYLTVFVAPHGQGVYGLITARDSAEGERRLYCRQRRT